MLADPWWLPAIVEQLKAAVSSQLELRPCVSRAFDGRGLSDANRAVADAQFVGYGQ
jgi:hypothetical protein